MTKLPLVFQRKITIDTLVKLASSQSVVDFGDYKRLKEQQELARYSCEQTIKFANKK